MKQFVFLKSRGTAAALHAWLLDRFSPPAEVRAVQLAINLVAHPDIDSPWDAVLEVWGDNLALLQDPASWEEFDNLVSRRAVYTVTELVEKDCGPVRGWPTPGVKLLVPWVGRADVAPAEQRRHWDEHVLLANRIHLGVTRYVRNWIEPISNGTSVLAPPYTGIATQHFLTERDLLERSFDSPASVQVITDDVADFIAGHLVLRVMEFFRTAGQPR